MTNQETAREALLKKIKEKKHQEKVERIEDKFWGIIVEEIGGTVCVHSEDVKALREIIKEYTIEYTSKG